MTSLRQGTRIRRHMMLAGVAGVLAVGACGDDEAGNGEASPAATPAEQGVPPELAGGWEMTLTDAQVKESGFDTPPPSGKWRLALREDGWFVTARQAAGTEGPLEVEGDRLRMRFRLPGYCRGGEEMVYSWRVSGDQLELEPVDDPCDPPHSEYLARNLWRRVEG